MKFIKMFLELVEMITFALGAFAINWFVFPVLSIFIKGKKRRKVFSAIIHRLWKFFIWLMDVTQMVKAHGIEDLAGINNKIIAASHPGLLDIVFLIGIIPNSLCLAKKELLHNPFMRNIVKSLYIINDIDPEDFQKTASEALNDGYNIIIFPTGTRTLPGEEIKIHKGAAQLAITNKINIVPIKISIDFPFLAKQKNPFDISAKTVNYYFEKGEEINIQNYLKTGMDEIKIRKHLSEDIKKCIN